MTRFERQLDIPEWQFSGIVSQNVPLVERTFWMGHISETKFVQEASVEGSRERHILGQTKDKSHSAAAALAGVFGHNVFHFVDTHKVNIDLLCSVKQTISENRVNFLEVRSSKFLTSPQDLAVLACLDKRPFLEDLDPWARIQ